MIEFFRRLFTDETAFVRAVRALFMAVAVGIAASGGGFPQTKEQWAAAACAFIGSFLGAGEKNPVP